MTTTKALLAERMADLRDDARGNVAGTVAYLLGGSHEYLMDERDGGAVSGVERAAENVEAAIRILEHERDRLYGLAEVLVAEAMAHQTVS